MKLPCVKRRFLGSGQPELLTFPRSGLARATLEVVASVDGIPLFDKVHAVNPVKPQERLSHVADVLTHSALSVFPLVHEAIVSRQQGMLQHLRLAILPISFPLQRLYAAYPYMTAIPFCDPPNVAAYNLLALDPRTDTTIRWGTRRYPARAAYIQGAYNTDKRCG